MAGMDHDSNGHGFLMFLILGAVLMVMVLIFTLTGRCPTRYRWNVSRAEDPKMYWQSIGIYSLLGLSCLGLYVYTLLN